MRYGYWETNEKTRIQYELTRAGTADRSELTKGLSPAGNATQNTPSIGTLLDIIQCLGTT